MAVYTVACARNCLFLPYHHNNCLKCERSCICYENEVGQCIFKWKLMKLLMITIVILMVLMMLTVCWNLIEHYQGRTKLTVLVKGVLR